MRSMPAVLLLLPVVALAGGKPKTEEKPAATDTPAPLSTDMQTHWTFATNARDGVVHADLATARLWGRGMAEMPQPESLPTNWRPMWAEMTAAATKVSESADLEAAGARVGALALTCAECHSFTGGGPGHLILPLPEPKFNTTQSDMALHKWAAEWMWVGLIANDAEAWKRGADALIEEPFKTFEQVPKKDANQMEHVVHIVASLAEPGERAEQAERYGQLITACALCHTDAQKGGVKAPPQ